MLRLDVPTIELYDERNREFITVPATRLNLEHSLVSLSKWESIHKKPFLGKEPKTFEETIDYVRCMCLDEQADTYPFKYLPDKFIKMVNDYIEDPSTATTVADISNGKPNKKIITAEVIYHWMFSYQISIECEEWHLNRLLTLIRVANAESAAASGKKTKTPMKDRYARNAEINARNRAKYNSKG